LLRAIVGTERKVQKAPLEHLLKIIFHSRSSINYNAFADLASCFSIPECFHMSYQASTLLPEPVGVEPINDDHEKDPHVFSSLKDIILFLFLLALFLTLPVSLMMPLTAPVPTQEPDLLMPIVGSN
jgi:hypothetical protein